MFERRHGSSPVERWIHGLSEQKFAALDAAITHVLSPFGQGLLGTPWLKRVASGVFEFRIQHSERQILKMYAEAGLKAPRSSERITLRVFVAFHSDHVILLLHGYDKGKDPSAKRQQREIREAKRRLDDWRIRSDLADG